MKDLGTTPMSVPVGQFFQLLRNFEEGLNRAANGSTKNIDVRSAYVPTANADMVMAGNDLDIATEIGRTIIKGRLRSRPMLECKLTKAGYDLLEFRRPMTIREVSQSLKMHGVAPLSYLHADWEWVGRLDMHILDLSEEHDEKYYGYIQGGIKHDEFGPDDLINTRYVIPVVPIALGTLGERIERVTEIGWDLWNLGGKVENSRNPHLSGSVNGCIYMHALENLKEARAKWQKSQARDPDERLTLEVLFLQVTAIYVALAQFRRCEPHMALLLESTDVLDGWVQECSMDPVWATALVTRLTRS